MNDKTVAIPSAGSAPSTLLSLRYRRNLLERTKIFLMIAPAITAILILFIGSLLFALGQSLGYLPVLDQYDLKLDAYQSIFSNPRFWLGTAVSFHIAFTSTVVSTALAIACALVLRETFWGKRFISWLFQFSLAIPSIVVALAVLLLMTQSGLLSRLAYAVGLTAGIDGFPELVFDKAQFGIIFVYVLKEVPFIAIIVLAILQGVGREHEETAATLGAGLWKRFWFVTLPLIAPGTVSAFIIVFAYIFGTYEIPYLLGRTDFQALPVLGLQFYLDFDLNSRAESMALNVFMAVFILILTGFYMRITRLYLRQDK